MISQTITERDVRRIVFDETGQEPVLLERMTFGHKSYTFLARLAGGRELIVRSNVNPGAFATTARNLDVLRELGLPVSRMVSSDLSCSRYSFAYKVMESISGRDLRYELSSMSRGRMSRLAEQLIGCQKKVASLPAGEGFGYVGIGERGPLASWWDFIYFDAGEEPPAEEPMQSWHFQIAALIQDHQAYLRAVPATCFLDDVTVKNVMVQAGELQGLIDFDGVCYGDPLWWIGLTAAGVLNDVGIDELFYVDELCRLYGLIPEQERVVPLYCAMHAAGFIGRSDGSERNPLHEGIRSIVERWIAEAAV